MTTLPEHELEDEVLDWLSNAGWETYSENELPFERPTSDWALWEVFQTQVEEINECIDGNSVERVENQLRNASQQETLLETNKAVTSCLLSGVYTRVNGQRREKNIDLIDFNNPENNSFIAVQQFRYTEATEANRPDIVLFVNGLPVSIIELKSSAQGNTVNDGISQLERYERTTPNLFSASVFNISATKYSLEYGAPGADREHYNPWNTEAEELATTEDEFTSLCHPSRILEFISDFTFFVGNDAKIIPRHPQYFAVKEIIKDFEEAKSQDKTSQGLIWHTQGSGKTFAMLYAARYLRKRHDAQVIILVDRDNLRGQLESDLKSLEPDFSEEGSFTIAKGKTGLHDAINSGRSMVVVSTIQLFEDAPADLQSNPNTVVMEDEAHRYMEQDLGADLRRALPNAFHYGFTGTPVVEDDRDTFENYDNERIDKPYLHRYSMEDACNEGVILEMNLEPRSEKIEWGNIDGIDERIEEELSEDYDDSDLFEAISSINRGNLGELQPYVNALSYDIVEHFTNQVEPTGLKGMVVTQSRKSAAMYGERLQEKLGEDAVDVIYVSRQNDPELIEQFHKSAGQREKVVDKFEDEDSELKMLVVCDMLLTGFDAPVLRTIYLDKQLKPYRFMQAVARANRPKEGKPFGEIVGYRGQVENFDEMFDYIDEEIGVYTTTDKEQFIELFEDQLSDIRDHFGTELTLGVNDDKWLQSLGPEKNQDKFKRKFKEMRDLRNAILPDPRIREYDRKYNWYESLYHELVEATGSSSTTGSLSSEEIAEVIEDELTVDVKQEETETIDVTAEDIEANPVRLVRQKNELISRLSNSARQSPRNEKLSERIKKLIKEWNQGVLDSNELSDELDELQSKVAELEDESKEMKAKNALYDLIATTDSNPDSPELLVEKVIENYKDEIISNGPMLPNNAYEKTSGSVMTAVAEAGEARYHTQTDFTIEATDYLLKNWPPKLVE